MCGKYLKLAGNVPTHLRCRDNIRSRFDVFTIFDLETNRYRKKVLSFKVLDQTLKSGVYLCFCFEGNTAISGLFLR